MEWIIGLLALILSGISLTWQVITHAQSRPRITVSASTGIVASSEGAEGQYVRNRSIAVVTAHAFNGPIGIRSIEFEVDVEPSSGWQSQAVDMPGMDPTIDLLGNHAALAPGATVTWRYHFLLGNGEQLPGPTSVTPTLVLTNGRRRRAAPIQLYPDSLRSNIGAVADGDSAPDATS